MKKNMKVRTKKLESKPIVKPTAVQHQSAAEWKVRVNEGITTAQVNKILDALDRNKGYCPCQKKSATTKCRCFNFVHNTPMGEPCICGLFVKMPIEKKATKSSRKNGVHKRQSGGCPKTKKQKTTKGKQK